MAYPDNSVSPDPKLKIENWRASPSWCLPFSSYKRINLSWHNKIFLGQKSWRPQGLPTKPSGNGSHPGFPVKAPRQHLRLGHGILLAFFVITHCHVTNEAALGKTGNMTHPSLVKILWVTGLILFFLLFSPQLHYPAHGGNMGPNPDGWGSPVAGYQQ
jgi:hypothetical protein